MCCLTGWYFTLTFSLKDSPFLQTFTWHNKQIPVAWHSLARLPLLLGDDLNQKRWDSHFSEKAKRKCNNNISILWFSVDALKQKNRNHIGFLLKFLIVHLYKIPGRSINSPLGRNYGTKFMETLSLNKNYTKLHRHPHVSVQISLYR